MPQSLPSKDLQKVYDPTVLEQAGSIAQKEQAALETTLSGRPATQIVASKAK